MTKMGRGRPRKTDPEEALQAAMLTFWKKGYDAASMSDLVDATGMAKPGLYATFGDKKEIYKQALTFYVGIRSNDKIREIFESGQSAKDTFREFLNALADKMCDPSTPDGCFLVNTLMKSENDEPEIKEMAKHYNDLRRAGFLDYLNRAQSEGKLSEENDPGQLADYLAAQVLTLASLQKIGTAKKELRKFIETVLTLIKD